MKGGGFGITLDYNTNLLRFTHDGELGIKLNDSGIAEIGVISALFEPYFGSLQDPSVLHSVIERIIRDPFSNNHGRYNRIEQFSLIVHNYQNQWHQNSDFVTLFKELHPVYRKNVIMSVVNKFIVRSHINQIWESRNNYNNQIGMVHNKEVDKIVKQYNYLIKYDSQLGKSDDYLNIEDEAFKLINLNKSEPTLNTVEPKINTLKSSKKIKSSKPASNIKSNRVSIKKIKSSKIAKNTSNNLINKKSIDAVLLDLQNQINILNSKLKECCDN